MMGEAKTNGIPQAETPAVNSLSLTEYTANPSPPSSTPKEKISHAGVPQEYLLPSGYPDVIYSLSSTFLRLLAILYTI